MSLHTEIKAQIKDAMLKKEAVRLTVLRGLVAAFTNELVAKSRKPQEELADEEVLTVIRRSVKQHKDSIDQFTKGNRPDLVEGEAAELVILEAFLPATMPKDEIKKVAEAKMKELGITDKTKMNQLMGALMKDLKGKAEGSDVKSVIESLF